MPADNLFIELGAQIVRSNEPTYLKPDIGQCYREENSNYCSGHITLLFEHEQDQTSKVDFKVNAEKLMQKLCNVTEQVFGKCCSIRYYYGKKTFTPDQEIVKKFEKEVS